MINHPAPRPAINVAKTHGWVISHSQKGGNGGV
jgi:hypothetical protein